MRSGPTGRCQRTSRRPNRRPSRISNSVAGTPPLRPEVPVPAGGRRSPDGRSVRPSPLASWPGPFVRFCPLWSAHLAPGCLRHGDSESPHLSPEVGSSCRRTSCSRSGTACSSNRLRTPRASPRPHPVHPGPVLDPSRVQPAWDTPSRNQAGIKPI